MTNGEIVIILDIDHLSLIRHSTFDIRHSTFSTMPDIDAFDCFRYLVGWIATIYATVVTVQSALSWYDTLARPDKYLSILRRYLIVHGLRVRLRRFGGDAIISLLLCVAFVLLWEAHAAVASLKSSLEDARRSKQPITFQWRGPEAAAEGSGR
jgi:hypothetical protein